MRGHPRAGFDPISLVPLREAFQQIAGREVAQLGALLKGLNKTASVETVHALRSALRRIQALLRLFEDDVAPQDAAWIDREVKWLGRRLGPVRDLDVFADHFPKKLRTDPDGMALAEAAHTARDLLSLRARTAADSARAAGLMQGLTAWLEVAVPLQDGLTLRERVGEVLGKADRKARGEGDGVEGRSREVQHRLRRRLRMLRDATSLTKGAFPDGPTQAYLESLSALNKVLGDLNDAAVAQNLAQDLTGGARGPKALRTVLSRRRAHRRLDLADAWAWFKATPAPWDVKS